MNKKKKQVNKKFRKNQARMKGLRLASLKKAKKQPVVKKEVAVEKNIDTVVVGLPLGIDASETAQSKHTRSFISQLNSVLDIDIVTIDESFSSVEAKTYLSGDMYKSQSSGRLDSASACVILNRFLKQTG